MPKNWSEAFRLLWDFLKGMPVNEKKKIIFIDELPWMDTPKSNFVYSLDHFWNAWATTRKDIILVICGSATSWIIDNVIMNYGGLHNRLTCQVHLQPFVSKNVNSTVNQRIWVTRIDRFLKLIWHWEEYHTTGAF